MALKRPSFRHVSDFSADAFGVPFDYALAQSIFSHTYPDMAVAGLRGVATALSSEGLLFATFFSGEETPDGSGWPYPGIVPYRWPRVRTMEEEAGLGAEQISWPHPLQEWFVAGLPSASGHLSKPGCGRGKRRRSGVYIQARLSPRGRAVCRPKGADKVRLDRSGQSYSGSVWCPAGGRLTFVLLPATEAASLTKALAASPRRTAAL